MTADGQEKKPYDMEIDLDFLPSFESALARIKKANSKFFK